jgi:muramoyltetrapeptide carboxypeptidase
MRRRNLLLAGLSGGLLGLAPGRAGFARAAPVGHEAWPVPLRPGSRVAALAPGTWLEAGDGVVSELGRRCARRGWTLLTPPELFGRWRWFSGTDQVRSQALRQAWKDSGVEALFYVGAGWGSSRVLEQGWRIPPSPRWTVGFSDCSALLLAQWAAGSRGGIHGWFGGEDSQWERLAALLEGRPVESLSGTGHGGGAAEGRLVVSNLTIANSLIGTRWLPSLDGAVLVLEDVGEAPYRIDRMLTQWRASGLLRGVRGIGLGRFSWKEEDVLPGDFAMDEILLERLTPLGIPLVSGLPVGHGRPNLALPIGRPCRIDGTRGSLTLL